ncbi:MAG: hypothetical protein JW832_18425 [Deltaproteobacteria bacterium]|nr:hypothetical protein [Deltaproteobacteria bacterium]
MKKCSYYRAQRKPVQMPETGLVKIVLFEWCAHPESPHHKNEDGDLACHGRPILCLIDRDAPSSSCAAIDR